MSSEREIEVTVSLMSDNMDAFVVVCNVLLVILIRHALEIIHRGTCDFLIDALKCMRETN